MRCENCNAELSPTTKFCSQCGTKVPPKAKGDLNIGGDYVGGDKVSGDKIGGNKVTVKDSTGVVVGDRSQVSVGLSGEDIAMLFGPVHQKIGNLAVDPDDKEEMTEIVRKIEKEVVKGEEADPDKVERWLRFLGQMSGDVLEVAAAALAGPTAAVATIIKNVARKAKEEASTAKNQ